MSADEKLDLLNRVLAHSRACEFYRGRVPKAPLKSVLQLTCIPITTKADLRQQSPWGLLCVPPRELYQYHESFGTSGEPVSIWLTRDDLLHSALAINRCGVALTDTDIVLVRYPYAISQIAHTFHAAAQMRGACVIPASSRSTVSPFPRVVRMMHKLQVSVLASLPLQATLLAETAQLVGLRPGEDFARLRAICTAGELLTPWRRRALEKLWRAAVFDNFGTTETGPVALDCAHGRLHPVEDHFILEVLMDDLMTPAVPGEVGYLVVTTLRRRATPVIRYLTGDRARLIEAPCRCGAPRQLELRGRAEECLDAGGRVLDRWDLEAIVGQWLANRSWVVGPHGNQLHYVVEAINDDEQLPSQLWALSAARYGIGVHVEMVPKGTLYDRDSLLDTGTVGKPRCVYSAAEMQAGLHLRSARL